MHWLRMAVVAATVLVPAGGVLAQLTGYEALSDWDALPNAKTGIVAGLAGSYDRDGVDGTFDTNQDYAQYESVNGINRTLVTVTGPGVVTRFWMPHRTANAGFAHKVTVDGVLVIDTDTDTFLGGAYGGGPEFRSPLVQTLVGGQVSYEPITFQNSLKIESIKLAGGGRHYYQVNYHRLPADAVVASYAGGLTASQQAARSVVVDMINGAGQNPAGPGVSSTLESLPAQAIAAGATLTLASPTGSGQIRALNLKLRDGMTVPTDAQLDGLRLRVRYDGDAAYAIDVPVSHYFGVGHGRADYQSLPLGVAADGSYYSYWPMPYRHGAAVELYNGTGSAIDILSSGVEYDAGLVLPQAGYLHAVYNEQTTVDGQLFHELLNVSGAGHYVGNMLFFEGAFANLVEGDDVMVVDGATTLFGTGLEDAYNGGFAYNHFDPQTDDGDVPNPISGTGPYNGLLRYVRESSFTRGDQYRWLIGDDVPFTNGIEVKQENYLLRAGVTFGSTAFYYALPEYIPGDANLDGVVGFADFAALQNHFGLPGGWSEGDFNADDFVTFADFAALWNNFGMTTSGQGPASIPEPGTLSLLVVGISAWVRWQRTSA